MASNRFSSSLKYDSRSSFLSLKIKCVFISHQKRDKAEAKIIADYLISIGVDVYFDEYDKDLKFYYQASDPKEVTNAICNGINNSSHMLVLVSPNTMTSSWVPFEIGFGYDKTDVKVLCLKGIPAGSLPEYVRAVPVIRDLDDLNNVGAYLSGASKELLERKSAGIVTNSYNQLLSVMDVFVNDSY